MGMFRLADPLIEKITSPTSSAWSPKPKRQRSCIERLKRRMREQTIGKMSLG
jgi:hypothetical protein